MLWGVVLPVALAAAVEGVDLDDGSAWERAPNALLDGPPGCWDAAGVARWDHDLGRWGTSIGEARFVGRMEDGVWGRFRVLPAAGGEPADDEPPFTPFFGQVRGLRVHRERRELHVDRSEDVRITPVSTVQDVLGKLTRDVETWEVSWDDESSAVWLDRSSVAGRKEAEVRSRTVFPGGGTLAEAHSVGLVGVYVHRGLVPARVRALDLRLEGRREGDVVLPVREVVSFELGLVVARVRASQEITYESVVPCPAR